MKKTTAIAEIAICAALSVVLSFISIFKMPQGGSVGLTMIPIVLVSIRRGAIPGMITGAIYGAISLAIDGVIYHPLSILLDYILAFGILGISGLFGKSIKGIMLGSVAGVFGRFVCSLVSGAVIFASYAPKGQNPWVYSCIYQATYLLPELVIMLWILVFLRIKAKNIFYT